MRWRIRPFAQAADREWAEGLWLAAMPAAWPLLPAGLAVLGDGLVAEAGTGPAGLVAVDMAGSIPLILVHPAWQGRGIGTGLMTAALDRLRTGGVSEVTAGSGGDSYIWPGVPRDLPAAVAFFTARGWRHTHDTLDLVADLAGYQLPAGAGEGAARAGVGLTLASKGDLPEVVAFEAATFPEWVRWFSAARAQVLIARDRAGNVAGALMLDGPGADTVFAPMLGPRLEPSAAWAWRRPCTGAASARPWSPGPHRSSLRRAPVPATSAGPPARPSTAAPATSPGADTPCSAAPISPAARWP